ncbi:MAG: hypothetical protein A2W26_13645 [Acidobacteria bacterium RBG_16_64_8]|nr:MAG: hypothetical protein A2W26_13645 [Acidobacteria bacterium RBG_16_64_8]
MNESLKRFQDLLRTLFQFDNADLDFGIYRILSYKRAAVEAFIEKDLPESIAAALRSGALAEQSALAQQLRELADQVRENLGEDALDGDGNLAARHHDTRLGRRYLDLQARARGAATQSALEATVFNHLYAFFSRYYDAGDFLSKRRYSKSEKYAVPYNGEEVYLHWANKDQYYIKTSEYFTDYRFTSGAISVRFHLEAAQLDHDNVKGEKRFFMPRVKEASFDAERREAVIPFDYRTLSKQETITYGQKNQQEAINAGALSTLSKHFTGNEEVLVALLAERRRSSNGEPVSYLEHHLRQYTRRNTSDFFVHKNLHSFLSRELDFYLKNEVLSLDEVEGGDQARAEGWFELMRTIRSVGHRIISFLSQIEDFQKRLFEKRKFVLETHYCITVGIIPDEFHAAIAANEAQWREWKELFHIDEEQRDLFSSAARTKTERRVAFLKDHPSLVLDTKHFEQGFIDGLLGSFEDIGNVTDGLLIHGENFQALNLVLEQERGQVKCVYIDPPYNSKTTEILYKNTYKHSSWLALMQDRLLVSRELTGASGVHVVAIDENEQERLGLLLEALYPGFDRTCVSVVHNPRGIQGGGFSYTHEYAYFIHPQGLQIGKRALEDEKSKPLMKTGGESARATARNCFYPIYVKNDQVVRFGEVAPDGWSPAGSTVNVPNGEIEVWPISSTDGMERKWRYARQSIDDVRDQLEVRPGRGGEPVIYLGKSEESYRTVWTDAAYNAAEHGSTLLKNIVSAPFSFPKSLYTVVECLRAAGCGGSDTVVDYFAGSGTTGHAVIHLNRQDGAHRRFVLAEMGQYFETVLLPRIKKIAFTPEWEDTKPKRLPTDDEVGRGPRIIKYVVLESYDDSLANITFDEGAGQPALRFDDYLLNYMLEWESKDSETFLNVERLEDPFSYKLRIVRDGQAQERAVDLPETFTFLLGLKVRSRKVLANGGRRYLVHRGTIDHREVVVIWRSVQGWSTADFERDRGFVASERLTEGADEVFVNGDSTIPRARSLDPVFKARMFAPVATNGTA